MKDKLLCIIPAKGGSTRLPRKNIAKLCGKAMIAYTIEAALKSGLFDEVFVSTEDDEVARVAKKFGAAVPYKRPVKLARDPAGITEVCLHMIDHLKEKGKSYYVLVILPPTSPLRTAEDVVRAYRLFKKTGAKFLMSVTEFEHSPLRAVKVNKSGAMSPYFLEYINCRSQELPECYRINGAIVICDVETFIKEKSYFPRNHKIIAYKMPWERSVDVDTHIDMELAEFITGRSG